MNAKPEGSFLARRLRWCARSYAHSGVCLTPVGHMRLTRSGGLVIFTRPHATRRGNLGSHLSSAKSNAAKL